MTHEIHEKPAQGSAAHPRRWRILGLLGVAQLMLILDVTVVAIALPRIEIDLSLSRAVVTWTVSAYTLTFGGLLLLGGRIADLAGDNGWLTATSGWLLLLAAVGYLAFVMRQKTAGTPLLDVRLLARRPVATGTFLILMATALMIAVFFLGTFYFQHARGYGPLQT